MSIFLVLLTLKKSSRLPILVSFHELSSNWCFNLLIVLTLISAMSVFDKTLTDLINFKQFFNSLFWILKDDDIHCVDNNFAIKTDVWDGSIRLAAIALLNK